MTTLVVLFLLWLVGYYLACQIWPYKACGRCQGGKHESPSGKAWRNCFRCGGSGKKRRLLARKP
ncbi:hypothetical protein [Amycolatopsis sp. NPDC051903]|uniref:hypothetical protein n=1 Tax=Amycolatopsis sp. NPDC051903 TaxID=3363936 RepID=UPI00379DA8D7